MIEEVNDKKEGAKRLNIETFMNRLSPIYLGRKRIVIHIKILILN
jgi:hypothetical protein